MTDTLQIIDPADNTTVLFDLNDGTGANNATWGSVKTNYGLGGTFELGAPPLTATRFEPSNRSGGTTVFTREGLSTVKWRQFISGTSYDNLLLGVSRLQDLLTLGGVIKWQPTGAGDARYIDFEPSMAPALFNGREAELLQVILQFQSPTGIDIELTRQPYVRLVELAASANVLTNPTMLLDSNANGIPDGWTLGASYGSAVIQSANEAAEAVISTSGNADLYEQTGSAASAAAVQVWSFSIYARLRTPSSGMDAFARIDWRNSSNVNISNTDGTTASLTTAWQRLTVSGTAPTNTDRIRVVLRTNNTTAVARTPQLRNAQLELAAAPTTFRVGAQATQMSPSTSAGMAVPFYNAGSAPAPVILKATGDSGSTVQKLLVAKRGNYGLEGKLGLVDLLNTGKYAELEATGNGWTITLGANTSSTADANASGGNMARCTHATSSYVWQKRVTGTRTTNLAAFRGVMDVYMRAKALNVAYEVQLRWSPSTTSPAFYAEPVVKIDNSLASGPTAYSFVKIGRTRIPVESSVAIGGMGFEIWTRMSDGSSAQNLDMDYLFFVPADAALGDRQGWLTVPGSSSEFYDATNSTLPGTFLAGSAITSPGSLVDGVAADGGYKLNANNAAIALAPPGGLAWPVGRHRIVFEVLHQSHSSLTFQYRIRDVTDADYLDAAGNTTVATNVLPNYGDSFVFPYAITFDSESGDSYQPQVAITAYTQGAIFVRNITHTFQASVGNNESMRSDPGSVPTRIGAEKLDSSGNIVSPLTVDGAVPVEADPGLNVFEVVALEIPPPSYPYNESKLSRTMTITPTYAPRFYE